MSDGDKPGGSQIDDGKLHSLAKTAIKKPRPSPVYTEEGEEEWLIDEIVAERRRGREKEYRVRWYGYGPEDDSWLPACELAECEALDKWEVK